MAFSRGDLADLNVFTVVARHQSFRRAAAELSVSTSALSHSIKNLEARLGVRLLNRTSRTVVLTHAGEAFLERLERGFQHIGDALDDLNRFREAPIGRLRLNVPRDAAHLLLRPVLPDYLRAYPAMELEVIVDDNLIDIVAGGYDAGIRHGGTIPENMISMRLGPPLRWVVVGSPVYLQQRGVPQTPQDLGAHACIRLRCDDAIHKWEFKKGEEARALDVPGPLIVNDLDLAIQAAEDGLGLAFCIETQVPRQLAEDRLRVVLSDWCPPEPGFQIYYPSRRQVPAGLRSLIEMIRARHPFRPDDEPAPEDEPAVAP